jgi:hypothetical protein
MVTIERGCATVRFPPSKSLASYATHSYSPTLTCCAMTEEEETEFWLVRVQAEESYCKP